MAEAKYERPVVAADLVESTPGANGLGYWLLASPLILFIAWLWEDIFAFYSPLPRVLDWALGIVLFVLIIILPFGVLAHRLITSFPRLFSHAGWDIMPLEPVREADQYMVRYTYHTRRRAPFSWRRLVLRAAQGWVYLEIIAIFVGAIAMIPLFFSAVDFGFGQ